MPRLPGFVTTNSRWRVPIAGVTFLGLAVTGCAGSQAVGTVRGESGPVAWEVSDIRERSEDQGRLVRWTFTVTLRNTGSTGINLTTVSRDVQAPLSDVWGGQERSAGQRRLDAGSALRLSEEFAYRCRDCDIGYAASTLGRGITRIVQYEGTDDQGRSLVVTVRIPLHRGAGTASPEQRAGLGATGRYHGLLSYYPARTSRRYPAVSIQAILEQVATELSGEIASREERGTVRAIVQGEEFAGEFRLGEVACKLAGQVSGGGATITGTFECADGEAGSLVINRM